MSESCCTGFPALVVTVELEGPASAFFLCTRNLLEDRRLLLDLQHRDLMAEIRDALEELRMALKDEGVA